MESTTGRFTSVDPLAEKYYSWSPYAYVGNNPLKFIDPTGEEVINGFQASDSINYAGAEYHRKYNDDDAIHIYGHGNSSLMRLFGKDGKLVQITNATELFNFLEVNSITWQNTDGTDQLTIVLHTCRSADNSQGTSLAEDISSDPMFYDQQIIGASQRTYNSERGHYGIYTPANLDANGDVMDDSRGRAIASPDYNKPGHWKVYEKGKEIGGIKGNVNPRYINPQLRAKISNRIHPNSIVNQFIRKLKQK